MRGRGCQGHLIERHGFFPYEIFLFEKENREEIISELHSMPNIEFDNDEDETMFSWVFHDEKAALETTLKGRIRVEVDHLYTECNSKSRDEKLRVFILDHLGELVAYDESTYEPFDLDSPPQSSEGPAPLDLNDLPEEARSQITNIMEQQFMDWIDKEIPALENKTPKEAVKTIEGREKIINLINDWENSQLRFPNPQFHFEFNKLRRALGIEEE